jgi:uncharacterized protein YlxP (DUF503 family)
MHVAAMRVDLRVLDAHSLKDKRRVMKSLTAQVAKAQVVAVAEVDHQDLWQRATLGIAAVSAQPGQVDRILHSVERDLRGRADVEVLGVAVSHLEEPE